MGNTISQAIATIIAAQAAADPTVIAAQAAADPTVIAAQAAARAQILHAEADLVSANARNTRTQGECFQCRNWGFFFLRTAVVTVRLDKLRKTGVLPE